MPERIVTGPAAADPVDRLTLGATVARAEGTVSPTGAGMVPATSYCFAEE